VDIKYYYIWNIKITGYYNHGMGCGYQKLGNYFYLTVCGFFVDAVVLFFHDNIALGLWMLSFGRLLTSIVTAPV